MIQHEVAPEPRTAVLSPQAQRGEIGAGPLAALLTSPAMIFLLAIVAYPLSFALVLVFHRVGASELRSGEMPFVGLANVGALLSDDVFRLSLQHTFVFVAISVAAELLLGMALALLINEQGIALSRVTRVLILLPWAVPPIVNGLLWSFIYNSKYGYLNALLYNLFLIDDYVQWTGNADLALLLVTVPYIWRTVPFAVLLFHATLQGIPEELYEAAEIDGAGGWQRFRGITLPLLLPTVAVVLVLRTSFAFTVFDEIFAITGGGPGNATWTAAWYIYRTTFQPPFEIGIGAAAAYVLAAIVFVIAFIYVRFLYRDVQHA
ncbi:MAG: sugar ABC transporter permease [Chloroflexi bacterium]|nr:sugar ABC transporter permease [Chloroflexota bacterium]